MSELLGVLKTLQQQRATIARAHTGFEILHHGIRVILCGIKTLADISRLSDVFGNEAQRVVVKVIRCDNAWL